MRKIPRSIHEAARDKARAIAKTEAYVVSSRERKKVEMLFAHPPWVARATGPKNSSPLSRNDWIHVAKRACVSLREIG